MRIAIGQLAHETNTFVKGPTTTGDFARHQGEEIRAAFSGTRSYLGGMLDRADELGIETVPTVSLHAVPSGTIAAAALEEMLGELVARVRAALPVDAVALALHGAGVAEGDDDIETTILRAVRDAIGPGVPLAATLDLHGNLTQDMVDAADGLFGVALYPHTDAYERGVEVVDFLAAMVDGRVRPAMHLERLPMMITTTTTDLDPARRMNEVCADVESRPGVLDCTIFHGFSHTDVPIVGVSVLAIADADPALAAGAARQVGEAIWEAREEYRPRLLTAEQALAAAAGAPDGLVVINDTSDNPGGGGPGDATHLLRAMLAAGLPSAAFGCVFDPEVAAQAHAAGTGATIRARLGGRTDEQHGAPIEADAAVKVLSDGRFVSTTPMLRGVAQDVGPSARLVIDGVDVIVTSRRQQVFDDQVFLLHGIDVRRRRIVGLKSSHHFRAGFRDLAAAIITADTPGATTNAIERLGHRRVRRPLWPLDAMPEDAYPPR